jgi:hypothetical protein
MKEGTHMATAEEWAERMGTTVVTEEEFIQLNDWQVNRHITGISARVIDDMSPAEVDEYVAESKARGEGLVGVLPPYTGPDDLVGIDSPFWHSWNSAPSRVSRQKMRVVFIEPDPNPQLQDPDAVTFTPDDAIARVRQRQNYEGMGTHMVGPVTDIRAALMTMPEVHALLEHGTPPGRPGTTPGALVCLVMIHGSFEVRGRRGTTSDQHTVAFEVCDSRKGYIIMSRTRTRDIVLP